MAQHTPLKPSHYPFRYEEQSNTFMPKGRLVTADGQILVDGINSGDFGYRLEKCVNFCKGVANSDLEGSTLANMCKQLGGTKYSPSAGTTTKTKATHEIHNTSKITEVAQLRQDKAELVEALQKIAYKPLADGKPEATLKECFDDTVEIAKAAIAKATKEPTSQERTPQ